MSSPRTYVGSIAGVIQLENRRLYGNQVGHTLIKSYKGTESACGSALNALITAGGVKDASIEHDAAGMYTLTVTYSSESAVADGGTESAASVVTTWDRRRSRTEKSLWTVPAWVTLTNTITAADPVNGPYKAAGLRTAMQDYVDGSIQFDALTAVFEANGLSANNETLSQLIDHFRKGTESYFWELFVLSMTQSGPLSYLQNTDSTINKLWSRASIIALPGMTSAFADKVPAGYFLQSAADVQQVDSFRYSMVTTWDHVTEYDSWLYGDLV